MQVTAQHSPILPNSPSAFPLPEIPKINGVLPLKKSSLWQVMKTCWINKEANWDAGDEKKKSLLSCFFMKGGKNVKVTVVLQSWVHNEGATGRQFLCYTPGQRLHLTEKGCNPQLYTKSFHQIHSEISGKLLKWSAVCLQSTSDNPQNPLVFRALHHYWHVGPDRMEMSWTLAKGSWTRSDIYHWQ